MTEQELIVGDYYWVQITLDPDAEYDWENQDMPARYAVDGKWFFLNQEGASNWYVKWIGENISQQAARIKELEAMLEWRDISMASHTLNDGDIKLVASTYTHPINNLLYETYDMGVYNKSSNVFITKSGLPLNAVTHFKTVAPTKQRTDV